MTEKPIPTSRCFAASVPGAGHIRYGIPCQDASGAVFSPRPAAIVCDGRGSAKLSHFGAQGAVRAFFSQLNVLEPYLAGVLDREASQEKWGDLCRILYRTLLQVKLDLAAERGGEEKDFDFTVAFAVAGAVSIGCFQVGDGAIVLRNSGVCRIAFEPDKGEFANQTQFLRPGGDAVGKFHAWLFPAAGNEGVAITSDGPEHLMFRQPAMEPGPIFGQLFDDLAAGELCEQDLRDYLTRSAWASDPRGVDDRSIAIMLPGSLNDERDDEPSTSFGMESEDREHEAEHSPSSREERISDISVASVGETSNETSASPEDTSDEPAVKVFSPCPAKARGVVSPWIAAAILVAVILFVAEAFLRENESAEQGGPSMNDIGPNMRNYANLLISKEVIQ